MGTGLVTMSVPCGIELPVCPGVDLTGLECENVFDTLRVNRLMTRVPFNEVDEPAELDAPVDHLVTVLRPDTGQEPPNPLRLATAHCRFWSEDVLDGFSCHVL